VEQKNFESKVLQNQKPTHMTYTIDVPEANLEIILSYRAGSEYVKLTMASSLHQNDKLRLKQSVTKQQDTESSPFLEAFTNDMQHKFGFLYAHSDIVSYINRLQKEYPINRLSQRLSA